MAITSSAGDGIRITTAAKNGTLASQAGINSDQIKFDTTWAAVNNGNTVGVLLGRLIILRRGTATEEVRKITVGTTADTTITVHEAWTVAPTSGDTYHVSYSPGDCTLLTGCSLSTKTGVYEFTRRLSVGNAGASPAFAYFAITDQSAVEAYDNATTPTIVIESNGRFDIGYTFGGEPVGGGIIHCLQNVTSEITFQFNSGSYAKFYDPTIIAFRALLNWYCFGPLASDTVGARMDIQNAKIINHGRQIEFNATGSYNNIVWATPLTPTSIQGVWVGPSSTVDGWTLAGPYFTSSGSVGITTAGGVVSQSIEVRNVTWVAPASWNIVVAQSRSWSVVNPTWTINTASHANIGWGGTGNLGEVLEKYSFALATVSSSGDSISGSSAYIYEGRTNKDLPNYGSSDVSGAYSTDITTRRFTSGSTTLIVTQSGDFALKVYRYGFTSFAGGLTVDEPIEQQVTLTLDTNLDAANETLALAAGSSSIGPIKHSPGQTDPLPLKVFHYLSGSGTEPSTGQLVSGTLSTANGRVLEVAYGDNLDAYLVLSGWSGKQFHENETIGNGAGWSAKTDLSASAASFDEEFTWEYNCADYSLQTVYDYDRAAMAKLPQLMTASFLRAIEWGEDEQTHMLYSNGTSYFTQRNANLKQGVWLSNRGAGTINYMTSDSGSLFTPPTTVTFEITGLKTDSEVRIYNATTDEEISGTDSTVSSTFSYSYVYSGAAIDIYVVIFHLNWKDIRLVGLTLDSTDQSIPVQQQTDRVFFNG